MNYFEKIHAEQLANAADIREAWAQLPYPYLHPLLERVMSNLILSPIYGLEISSASPGMFQWRREMCHKYCWFIPSPDMLEAIEDLGRSIVSMGAGGGYFERLLQDLGIMVTAYDIAPPALEENGYVRDTHFDVHKAGPEKLQEHSDDVLFLGWPPYNTSFAYDCLRHYAGDTVVYVGESWGGCTGEDAFFEQLEKEWELIKEIDIPSWYGVRDYCAMYRRKA